jgi:methionyl-tRNA formyltransferase
VRLVFAGTPGPAVPSLQALLSSDHEVVAVVTRPPARAGRGRKAVVSPVRALAETHGIPVLDPVRPAEPEFVAALTELAPDWQHERWDLDPDGAVHDNFDGCPPLA